ncbi:MAG: type VI secretion system tip protein VgrG, partial [Sinomicrobium sp.]|nr:type VI secretion system tip protein VgrG [Sinomicrobium sp.]
MSAPIAIIINNTKKQEMDASFGLAGIDIIKEVNRIPAAEIVLTDNKQDAERFPISNSGFFDPGQCIEIKLRYADGNELEKTVFKGIVLRHHIKGGPQGTLLTVELKDPAFKLTTTRKSAVYLNKTDTEIVSDIVKEARNDEKKNGIVPATIAAPNITAGIKLYQHKEIVRYYCTDWDFMLSRTDSNGLLTITEDGEISVTEMPDFNLPQKHTFELGVAPPVFDFEMETNFKQQYGTVQSTAWDIKTQKIIMPKKARDFKIRQAKKLDPESISNAVGGYGYELRQSGEAEEKELQAWADAKMAKSRMAMVRGRIKTTGNAAYKVGDIIKIARVSDMFDEKTMISGVRHTVSPETGWQTHVQFGLSPHWFSRNEDIADTPAAGLLPPVNGLQIAVVDKFEINDQYRVKVRVPVLGDEPVWARLGQADAGDKRGVFLRPEPGDEVILGFFNDDPRQPVILGSLYSAGKHKIPGDFTVDKDNTTKGLVTKNGVKLHIDEKKGACTVT